MAEHAPPSRVTYDYVTRTIARTLGGPSRGYFLLLDADREQRHRGAEQ